MSVFQGNHQTVLRRPLAEKNSKTKEIKQMTAKKGGLETCNTNMITKHHHSVKKTQTTSVAKRNLRERTRVKGVNDGFGKLQQYVPNMKSKSSKVDTLRGAIEYIKHLKELLGEEIKEISNQSRKLEQDDLSAFSEMTDSSYSSSFNEGVSYINDIHPIVYQLPTSSTYTPPTNSSSFLPLSPILLPPVSSLSPCQERLLVSKQLPSMASIHMKNYR